jgi:hypothetical protein
VVYARTTGDKTLTLIVSGKLWRNSLIMQDRETESLWSHITGEAMDGAMKGSTLEYIPSVQTAWSEWVKEHPGTKVLRKEKEVRRSSYTEYFRDPDRIGIFRARWLMDRLPGKALVHGITHGPHALAIADGALPKNTLHNFRVGEEPIVAARGSDGGVRAWLSRLGDRTLHFERDGDPFAVRDRETRSTWDFTRGTCTTGELQGKVLQEIVVRTAFWFAWSHFYPNTSVIDGPDTPMDDS